MHPWRHRGTLLGERFGDANQVSAARRVETVSARARMEMRMAEKDVEALRKARESFVRKRRAMAEQMMPAGAASAHFAPAFADLQAAIEAIDRAIKDEEQLPPDYAQEEPAAAPASVTNGAQGSNVVDVDFDPA